MLPVAACLAVHTVIAAGMKALYSAYLAIFTLPGTLGDWHLDMEPWVRIPSALAQDPQTSTHHAFCLSCPYLVIWPVHFRVLQLKGAVEGAYSM